MTEPFLFVLAVLGTQTMCAQYKKYPAMYDSEDYEVDLADVVLFDPPVEPSAHSDENKRGLEEARHHRVRRVFDKFARSIAAKADAAIKDQQSLAFFGIGTLRFALLKWQVQAFFARRKRYLASDELHRAARGAVAARAILNMRTGTALDPRYLVVIWPEGKSVDHIFLLSANFHRTSMGRTDTRSKDIQVRFCDRSRVQLPLKIFNKHPDSVDMLAEYKAGQKVLLMQRNRATRADRTNDLMSKVRFKSESLARSKQRNSGSLSPGGEGAAGEKAMLKDSRSSLSNFLDHSLARSWKGSQDGSGSGADEEESDEEESAKAQY